MARTGRSPQQGVGNNHTRGCACVLQDENRGWSFGFLHLKEGSSYTLGDAYYIEHLDDPLVWRGKKCWVK